jgi:predicted secreted protein
MATGSFKGQGTTITRNGSLIAEIVNYDGPDGKNEFDDATNMDSVGGDKEFIPTLRDNGSLKFTANFLGMSNASQAGLVTAMQANPPTLDDYVLTFPGGHGSVSFAAYVENFSLKVPHDKKVDFSAALKISGSVTIS